MTPILHLFYTYKLKFMEIKKAMANKILVSLLQYNITGSTDNQDIPKYIEIIKESLTEYEKLSEEYKSNKNYLDGIK